MCSMAFTLTLPRRGNHITEHSVKHSEMGSPILTWVGTDRLLLSLQYPVQGWCLRSSEQLGVGLLRKGIGIHPKCQRMVLLPSYSVPLTTLSLCSPYPCSSGCHLCEHTSVRAWSGLGRPGYILVLASLTTAMAWTCFMTCLQQPEDGITDIHHLKCTLGLSSGSIIQWLYTQK